MAKVIICFVLTCVFSFLSFSSFMSNDYGPLKEWIAYYTEYKALQQALNEGNASKAEILAKLKAMYPERANELEAKFKEKYGNLKDSAQDTQDSVQSSLRDTLSKLQADSDAAKAQSQQLQEESRRVDAAPQRSANSASDSSSSHHSDDHQDSTTKGSHNTNRVSQ